MTLRLTIFFATLTTLAIIHSLANEFYLYWKYAWLDILMHALGGVTVALGISILPFFRTHFFERFQSLGLYVVAALLIGIAWEVFEVLSGIMVVDDTFISDTALDLLMDAVGVAGGYHLVVSLKKM